jgi:polyhydroxybutyrate depolymerase
MRSLTLPLVAVVLLGACSSDVAKDVPDDSARASLGCMKASYGPGVHKLMLDFGGITRPYDLVLPDSYDDSTPLPLLFNLHPLVLGGSLHSIWTSESGMNAKGNAEGFIVVQPDGTGSPASWNGGAACCDPAFTDDVDDVGYIEALAEEIRATVCVDERRVYAAGMSNGGYLSNRIGCEHPERVAAIAPVVSSLSPELACSGERPMPVFQISGSEDDLASKQASIDAWVLRNECSDHTTIAETGTVTCTTHDRCAGSVEVTHCVVAGGGHCAYTSVTPQATPGCMASPDIAAEDLIWGFVSRWRLP